MVGGAYYITLTIGNRRDTIRVVVLAEQTGDEITTSPIQV
jgi:hypothetical protein